MSLELDHIFILVSVGSPEGDRLPAFGLVEGPANTHPGQGSACRRFLLQNAYLELLWIHDPVAARSALVRPTHLWERWTGRNGTACPFALIFRPAPGSERKPPFSFWEYRPPYLAPSLSIAVGTNAPVLTEPMLCHVAFGRQRLPHHHNGLRLITRVDCILPGAANPSPELRSIIDAGLARVQSGAACLLDLGFDGETLGKHADLRPALPLVLRW